MFCNFLLGFDGLKIVVDGSFVGSMDQINSIAMDCGVNVLVTHAYRRAEIGSDGTVRPPGPNENSPHLVGHAIDLILETPTGLCSGDCLTGTSNSNALCFTSGIGAISNLEIGEEFLNDGPIHVAHDLWKNGDTGPWNDMYYNNQQNC